MRSPNKRSRSKSNRPKTLGNIVNRVFDSSGPEGKVRGTPQQIIEKYQFLARDAQLGNDRVAAENFQQHAEHYTRMLAQAQKEQAAEQEARRQQQDEQRARSDDRNRHNNNQNGGQNGQNGGQPQPQRHAEQPQESQSPSSSFDVAPSNSSEDGALVVETPEGSTPPARPESVAADEGARKPRNTRKPRVPKAAEPHAATAEEPRAPKPKAEGEETAAKPRRAPRKPRAPKADSGDTPPAPEMKSSAAE